MSEGVEELDSILNAAVLAGQGGWQEIGVRLAALPDTQARAALERLAANHGVAVIALLEGIASESDRPVAVVAVQALGTVADVAAASALERIAATANTDLRKAARRSLHKLASRGITPSAREAPKAEAAFPRNAPARKAMASPIDGAGNRGIWFVFDHAGGVDVVSLLLSDTEGVKDAFVRDFSIRRLEAESKKLLEDTEFPWIEMPADYCAYLVDVAHHLNASSGTPLPVEFLAWRDRLGPTGSPYQQPIIYTVISAAEVRWEPRYLDNSGNLFNLDLFKGWILDKDEIAEFVQERLAAQRTGLVLAGAVGESRDRMIEERAIQRVFDARKREIYRRRLEEMSYLLWKVGHLEAARQALAAALALEPAGHSLSGHPFVLALMEWSMQVITEMAREEGTRQVKPGVQLYLPY